MTLKEYFIDGWPGMLFGLGCIALYVFIIAVSHS